MRTGVEMQAIISACCMILAQGLDVITMVRSLINMGPWGMQSMVHINLTATILTLYTVFMSSMKDCNLGNTNFRSQIIIN